MMTTQARRIKKLVRARGLPERSHCSTLGKLVGKSAETVRQWFEKDINNLSGHTLAKIAKAFDADIEWLIEGSGRMDDGGKFDNARSTAFDYRTIPVLNYIQAGNPSQIIDDYAKGSGMDEITIDAETARGLSMDSFALVVMGNSMSPDFQEGDTVIVDPNVRPHPGDIVIAKLDRLDEATIKKFKATGIDESGIELFDLVALNPDYQPISVSPDNPGHIVGTVVRHIKNMLNRRR